MSTSLALLYHDGERGQKKDASVNSKVELGITGSHQDAS